MVAQRSSGLSPMELEVGTYPWLSGCPKAKLAKAEGSPVSQRNEALDVL